MFHQNKQIKNFLKKGFFFKKLTLILLILILSSLIFIKFILTQGKKTKASGEKIEVRFNPNSLSVNLNQQIQPIKIQGKPLNTSNNPVTISVRGYQFNITFNRNSLELISLTYPSSCPEVAGIASTINQANESGVIKIACANITSSGFLMSNDFNDLLTIIFKSKSISGTSNIMINPNENDIGFSKIEPDGGLTVIPLAQNQSIMATIKAGESSTPSPTPTPHSTQPLITPTPGSSFDSEVKCTLIKNFGKRGLNQGEFTYPHGLAVDKDGLIYVTSDDHRLQVFQPDGTFIRQWGGLGNEDGKFRNPRGIAIDKNSNIYVADLGNHRIQVFKPDGTFLRKWGKSGTGDGEFNFPHGIAVDNNNNVYVADTDNHRIQVFKPDGTFLRKWGKSGTGDGEFNRPYGIAVDNNNNVYVADTDNHRIQVFKPDGTFLRKLSDKQNLKKIRGITLSLEDYLYIINDDGNNVAIVNINGKYLSNFGYRDSEENNFNSASFIVVDSNNVVYISDSANHRIQVVKCDLLAPPKNLTANCSLNKNSINLSWHNSINAQGYYLSKKSGNNAWNHHYAFIPHPTLNYTDYEITQNTNYSYNIKSCRSQNDCPGYAYANQVNINCTTQSSNQNPSPTAITPQDQPSSTPTNSGNDSTINLNLSLKLQGIRKKPANQFNQMNIKVYAITQDNIKHCGLASVSSSDNGIWSGQVSWQQNEENCQTIISTLSNVKLLIKGPKHLKKRVCDAQPTENNPGGYQCDVGQITLQSGNNNLDLSGIYILVGDLSTQDGIANSYDASLIRQCLNRSDSECLSVADLNLDGIVNAQDYSLLIEALAIKNDDDE